MCAEAGIPLAGGHSIDSPEPIFGLAVNGLVPLENLTRNDTAQAGDYLLLTKPLGIGILTTAEKKGILLPEDAGRVAAMMMRLNNIGEKLGSIGGVTAMTDVTGFGLLGHLGEMCAGSGVSAEVVMADVPVFDGIDFYLENGAIPGGTQRNWASYGSNMGEITERNRTLLADPQTSGGLLVAVRPEALDKVRTVFGEFGLSRFATPIGGLTALREPLIAVV
jgi:selenide,water dikinase